MMLRASIATLLLAATGHGYGYSQILHLTMSQQGAVSLRTVAGKNVKGFGLLAVIVENDAPNDVVVDSGIIYAAVGAQRISFISPVIATATIGRSRAFSWPVLLLDGVNLGSSGVGIAGVAGAIHMSNGLEAVLTAGVPILVTYMKGKLVSVQPQDNVQLLQGNVAVRAHATTTVFVAYRYHGDFDPKATTITLSEHADITEPGRVDITEPGRVTEKVTPGRTREQLPFEVASLGCRFSEIGK